MFSCGNAMDFTTFDSECWDSTPFQEKFIQSYFKRKISETESINQSEQNDPSSSILSKKIKNNVKKLKKQAEFDSCDLQTNITESACVKEVVVTAVRDRVKRKPARSPQNIFKKTDVPEGENNLNNLPKDDLQENFKHNNKCNELGFDCNSTSKKKIKKKKSKQLNCLQNKKELLIANNPTTKSLDETGVQVLEKAPESKGLYKDRRDDQIFSEITSDVSDSTIKIKQQKNKRAASHCSKIGIKANAVADTLMKDSNKLPNVKSKSFSSKAHEKLQAAKFRYLNEKLYTESGKEAFEYFHNNVEEYEDYHLGYNLQVMKWPINPVDVVIKDLHKIDENAVIVDMGCGEAKIAQTFSDRIVHSFDLIALNECVTACDIAKVPLSSESVDVAIFCLSLMGTNLKDYLIEAHRILKLWGILKIAEVESRITDIDAFVRNLKQFGFSLEKKDDEHKMFIFLDLKKIKRKLKKSSLPDVTLKACLYKKR